MAARSCFGGGSCRAEFVLTPLCTLLGKTLSVDLGVCQHPLRVLVCFANDVGGQRPAGDFDRRSPPLLRARSRAFARHPCAPGRAASRSARAPAEALRGPRHGPARAVHDSPRALARAVSSASRRRLSAATSASRRRLSAACRSAWARNRAPSSVASASNRLLSSSRSACASFAVMARSAREAGARPRGPSRPCGWCETTRSRARGGDQPQPGHSLCARAGSDAGPRRLNESPFSAGRHSAAFAGEPTTPSPARLSRGAPIALRPSVASPPARSAPRPGEKPPGGWAARGRAQGHPPGTAK